VARPQGLLLDEHCGHVRVDSCFYYGAVDISPRYLVVWILLAGAPDNELPEWSTPEVAKQRDELDPSLVTWMEHLRQIVRDAFATEQWPAPDSVEVLFDSEHRAREGGGWAYFK
jgi:hypothetical protein